MPNTKDGKTTFTVQDVQDGKVLIPEQYVLQATHQERPLEVYRPEGAEQAPANLDADQAIAEFEGHAAAHSKDDDGLSL